MPDEEEDEPSFFAKHKIKIILGGVLVVALGVYFMGAPKSAPKKKSSSMVMISLPPPPPPPPRRHHLRHPRSNRPNQKR